MFRTMQGEGSRTNNKAGPKHRWVKLLGVVPDYSPRELAFDVPEAAATQRGLFDDEGAG